MLYTPANEWEWLYDNIASPTLGANNAKGSWVEAVSVANHANDTFMVAIDVSAGGAAGLESQALVDIGIDAAGGGSYTVLIPDLITSNGGDGSSGIAAGWIFYAFPLFIRAGTQIGVRGQTNRTSTFVQSVRVRLYGLPKYPELVKAGSFVTSFGVDAANSAGTALTPGTAAEGAWTAIGAATATRLWYWEYGFGVRDTSMNNRSYQNDIGIGDGSNKFSVINNNRCLTGDTERLNKPCIFPDGWYDAPAGVNIYARSFCSAAPDSNVSVAVYGVGG